MVSPPLHPEHAELVRRDGALPAVAAAALRPAALRQRFAAPPVWVPELRRDIAEPAATPRQAAVLVALRDDADGLQLLLTRRTAALPVHAGQISFPGGRRDPADVDLVATALREAHEEIGLAPDAVETLGQLPVYTTITGYAVTPVVGLLPAGTPLRPDPGEVDALFAVPLAFLMDPARHELRRWDPLGDGQARHFYAMPWRDADGQSYFIWGATAAMIRNLYRFLIA